MGNRSKNARTALETMSIVASGMYVAPSGQTVSIAHDRDMMLQRTELFTPADARQLRQRANERMQRLQLVTRFEVRNETTLSAARRLAANYGSASVAALNFASAKNPGGGYLSGSQAQEESLARASALVESLQTQMTYYDANRRNRSSLYTDHLIVSPGVPVFRGDDDELLDEPWLVTFLTSPAPNASAIAKNEHVAVSQIESTFRRRMEMMLNSAVSFQQTVLVLGAWGCGVFKNDPSMVARLFAEFLLETGPLAHAFQHVVFAVLDNNGETFESFRRVFGDGNRA